jgi:hypothetical protein
MALTRSSPSQATDLAGFIRHTNEFKFPIAAVRALSHLLLVFPGHQKAYTLTPSHQFHHAHEAYIVPDLLKTAWNSTPAVAIFATKSVLRPRSHQAVTLTRSCIAPRQCSVQARSMAWIRVRCEDPVREQHHRRKSCSRRRQTFLAD